MPDDHKKRLGEIYDRHSDYVYNSLRRLDVPERDLLDLCHEVFLVVHHKLDEYDGERDIEPWLFGIAYRVAGNYRRKASHQREHLEEQNQPPRTQDPEAPDKLERREAKDIVMKALQHIDIEKRAIFVLNELDGHSMTDVAESMSIPRDTAYSRLRAARKQFTRAARRIMSEEEAR